MFGKCSESCYYSRDLKAEFACKDPAYEVIVFSALYICLLKKLWDEKGILEYTQGEFCER